MNFKIVKVEGKEVLVQRIPDDEGNDSVQVSSYIVREKGEETEYDEYIEETINFSGRSCLSDSFIRTFDSDAALKFINEYE